MTFDQMKLQAAKQARQWHPSEHAIQSACVQWFRLQYPHLSLLIFAVPNGTNKGKAARGIFKAEGLLSGVADMLFLFPSQGFHGLCIEFKNKTGRQQPAQKEWQAAVEAQGYRYALCRSFDDFRREMEYYLRL